MYKKEFLEKLNKKIKKKSPVERNEILSYYEHLIDTRIENGWDEEDAVKYSGNIDQIAQEVNKKSSYKPRSNAADLFVKKKNTGKTIFIKTILFPLFITLLLVLLLLLLTSILLLLFFDITFILLIPTSIYFGISAIKTLATSLSSSLFGIGASLMVIGLSAILIVLASKLFASMIKLFAGLIKKITVTYGGAEA